MAGIVGFTPSRAITVVAGVETLVTTKIGLVVLKRSDGAWSTLVNINNGSVFIVHSSNPILFVTTEPSSNGYFHLYMKDGALYVNYKNDSNVVETFDCSFL